MLTNLLEARRRLIETTELERRLAALEAAGRSDEPGGPAAPAGAPGAGPLRWERLRVVEHWPGDPVPEAGPGELLVVLRRFGERPPPAPARR